MTAPLLAFVTHACVCLDAAVYHTTQAMCGLWDFSDWRCTLTNITALNSQSALGSSSWSPAALGSLEAVSPARSTPLHPAGPSPPLAAGPRRSSNPLLGRCPDVQQTRLVLTEKRSRLKNHIIARHTLSCVSLTLKPSLERPELTKTRMTKHTQ